MAKVLCVEIKLKYWPTCSFTESNHIHFSNANPNLFQVEVICLDRRESIIWCVQMHASCFHETTFQKLYNRTEKYTIIQLHLSKSIVYTAVHWNAHSKYSEKKTTNCDKFKMEKCFRTYFLCNCFFQFLQGIMCYKIENK